MNDLLRRAGDDPWSLDLQERQRLCAAMKQAQAEWLPMLRDLVEPPAPGDRFPAFLLDTPAFASLRELILARQGGQRERPQLDTATADTLQHFVDHYRDYLDQLHARSRVRA